ncbi:MAG: hypothetical protein EHM34_00555 [Nitrosopumilales archaeon]|nr:MAG: hypothetical protein EHM34_00555 [Nitrosopumilales archaeon]
MNIELPIHKEAEELVLGRMMNSINCANAIFENLEESDFFLPEHRSIYKAGYLLFSKDRKIDSISILAELQKHFPEHANYLLVSGLQSFTFGMTNDFMQFIEIVRDHAIYRKTIGFCREMMEASSSKKLNSDELKNKFLSDSDIIFKSLNNSKLRTFTEIGDNNFKDSGKPFLEYVEWKMSQAWNNLNTIEGHLSGYNLLDQCLEGFNKKHYIIIGARPGVGKTTFVLNLMRRFMERNLKIGFFSLEMSAEDVISKYACICSGVDHKKVSRGTGLTLDEFNAVCKAYKSVGDSIIIDDQPNLPVSQLTARAKRMVLANDVKVIFIDYLSEVKGEGRFVNKQEEMQHVSKSLRAIAKNLNVPVICIAQLNRESEKGNRDPIKSDLRESGQIEADAYSILLLHRDEEKRPGIMSLNVVKNRLGREAKFDFSFNGKTGEIEEIGYFKNNDHGATNQPNDPYKFLKQQD